MTQIIFLITAIVSSLASATSLPKSFPVDGPNCYNTALRFHNLIEEDRYMGLIECQEFLKLFFTEQPTATEPQDLDIIAYGNLAHVIVQKSQNTFFHKLGVAREYKRETLEKSAMNQLLIKSKVPLWPRRVYRYNGKQAKLYTEQEKKWIRALTELFIKPSFFNQAHLSINMRIVLNHLRAQVCSQFFHHALNSFEELTLRMIENAEKKQYANPFLCTALKPLSQEQRDLLHKKIQGISPDPTADILFDILRN